MGKSGPQPRSWQQVFDAIRARSEWQNGCLIWRGNTAGMGYGVICYNGKEQYIHRLIYKKMVCEIDPEVVRHSCDTPRCWNPNHLLGGTHADNVADKMKRGRYRLEMEH